MRFEETKDQKTAREGGEARQDIRSEPPSIGARIRGRWAHPSDGLFLNSDFARAIANVRPRITPESLMPQDETSAKPGSSNAESKAMRERWADPEFRKRQSEAIRRGQAAARLRRVQEKDEGFVSG